MEDFRLSYIEEKFVFDLDLKQLVLGSKLEYSRY